MFFPQILILSALIQYFIFLTFRTKNQNFYDNFFNDRISIKNEKKEAHINSLLAKELSLLIYFINCEST